MIKIPYNLNNLIMKGKYLKNDKQRSFFLKLALILYQLLISSTHILLEFTQFQLEMGPDPTRAYF